MLRTRRGTPVLVVLAAMLVVACTSDDQTSKPPVDLSQIHPLTGAEARFLAVAEHELVRRCMEAQGFQYTVVVGSVDQFEPSEGAWPAVDLDERRQLGYGIVASGKGAPSDPFSDGQQGFDPNQRYLMTLSPERQLEWQIALFGHDDRPVSADLPSGGTISTNADGCLSEARIQLFGDLARWLYLDSVAGGFAGEAVRRARAEARYAEAFARWSSCMRERGFPFEDRGDALDAAAGAIDIVGSHGKEAALAREIEIAVADGECDISVGLTETVNALIAEHSGEVNEDHLADVLALQEIQREALQRARELGIV